MIDVINKRERRVVMVSGSEEINLMSGIAQESENVVRVVAMTPIDAIREALLAGKLVGLGEPHWHPDLSGASTLGCAIRRSGES